MYDSYIITLFTERKERMLIVKAMSVRLYVIIQEPLSGFEWILKCPSTFVIGGQSQLAVFNFMQSLYTKRNVPKYEVEETDFQVTIGLIVITWTARNVTLT